MTRQPVSLAKTTRPSFAGVLPRERLFERLDQARASRAIWITSPPGSGKTTLAASYLEHRKLRSIWYQIDEATATSPRSSTTSSSPRASIWRGSRSGKIASLLP